MIIDGKRVDANGETKETISLSLREPARTVAPRAAIVNLVYERSLTENGIAEQLVAVCDNSQDAENIVAGICDSNPEWIHTEPKAFAESLPLTTYGQWRRKLVAKQVVAKLTAFELSALLAEAAEGGL